MSINKVTWIALNFLYIKKSHGQVSPKAERKCTYCGRHICFC